MGDRQKILDGVRDLERQDPSDSSDSGLYLPLMLVGCMAVVYIMGIKDTQFEKQIKSWMKRMSKKIQNSGEVQAAGSRGGGDEDWFVGTSASAGTGKRRNRSKK